MIQNYYCIDPGNITSGVAIMEAGKPKEGLQLPNGYIFPHIKTWLSRVGHGQVVIEDITGYKGILMGDSTISTIKFIGVMEWRLDSIGVDKLLIKRGEVKKWIFDTFPKECEERIGKMMVQRKKINKDGSYRSPSFIYVNDRVVEACIKDYWGIKKPGRGKSTSMGFKTHSWQALALGTLLHQRSLYP